MSDAGDEPKVDEVEVEAEAEVTEAPKGKLSVEDALQVRLDDLFRRIPEMMCNLSKY